MKLYATITSERASKGQGGNKFIKISLLVGNKLSPALMAHLELTRKDDTHYDLWLDSYLIRSLEIVDTTGNYRFENVPYGGSSTKRGKQQKGECSSQYWSKTCKGCKFCERKIDED